LAFFEGFGDVLAAGLALALSADPAPFDELPPESPELDEELPSPVLD
jgi:hypothetical protein